MHPLRGLAIVTFTTLFLLGAVGWMLPVSTNASEASVAAVECGSILRPASAETMQIPAVDIACQDARKFRGLLGAVGMGAGIVGLGLAVGIESSRPLRPTPQLRLITNRELESDTDRYPTPHHTRDTTRVH